MTKDRNVLVLQGGGALGSYQAGVVEAAQEKGAPIDWVAGISIGAINAAIVAGNPPQRRVAQMRGFWERVTSGLPHQPWLWGDTAHAAFNEWSAAWGSIAGAPGFFSLLLPPRAFFPPTMPGAISYYDTTPLRQTLLDFVDFSLINAKTVRLSVGAVDIETGNFRYFDNVKETIRPEHIMASGALPPGFPPIEIDGAFYWDGGLVSNTPLQYVLDRSNGDHVVILQIDLFPARGPLPTTLAEASEREKDIRFSSRTRLNTDAQVEIHRMKTAFRRLVEKLPAELRDDPDLLFLAERTRESSIAILQLIYRSKPYEGAVKDYEFSRATMHEHWAAGLVDARHALSHPRWLDRRQREGVVVFDLSPDAADKER